MLGAHVITLHEPDGTPVVNVVADLSATQLKAAAHAVGEVLVERHRGQELGLEAVLALRELSGVRDELDRLASAEGHATLVLPLARLIVLHDTLDEWIASRDERGWTREADAEALPVLRAMLAPLAGARADALAAALGGSAPDRA